MIYRCYESGVPCDVTHRPQMHPSWAESGFVKLEDAQRYMNNWLGILTSGRPLLVGEKYDSHDVIFEIRHESLRLWLDDIRLAPNEGWVHFKTGEDLLAYIQKIGLEAIDEISFDNDLGLEIMEGHHVLTKIEEMVALEKPKAIPMMFCHSQNNVASKVQRTIIARIRGLYYENLGLCSMCEHPTREHVKPSGCVHGLVAGNRCECMSF